MSKNQSIFLGTTQTGKRVNVPLVENIDLLLIWFDQFEPLEKIDIYCIAEFIMKMFRNQGFEGDLKINIAQLEGEFEKIKSVEPFKYLLESTDLLNALTRIRARHKISCASCRQVVFRFESFLGKKYRSLSATNEDFFTKKNCEDE